MLIKDNEGDWGICVAVWRGMKKGVPGVPGMEGLPSRFLHAMCQALTRPRIRLVQYQSLEMSKMILIPGSHCTEQTDTKTSETPFKYYAEGFAANIKSRLSCHCHDG